MLPLSQFSRYSALVTFCLGLPTAAATYYQAWKARQEAAEVRAGLEDGCTVNLVPLDTLHTLPRPGEIVLLPGSGGSGDGMTMGAYRVGRVEHIYARFEGKKMDAKQARLIKTVAHVESLFVSGTVEEVDAMLTKL